jgi:hypothetical protein
LIDGAFRGYDVGFVGEIKVVITDVTNPIK